MEDFKAKARQIMQIMNTLAINFRDSYAENDYKEAYRCGKRFAAEFQALKRTLSAWTEEKRQDATPTAGKPTPEENV